MQQHLDRLDQRRRELEKRIQAKQAAGKDFQSDQAEYDALAWVIDLANGQINVAIHLDGKVLADAVIGVMGKAQGSSGD